MEMKEALVLRAARFLGGAMRLTGQGGGTALPGLLVERAAPALIPDLAGRLDAGSIVVSGTNGKTTTTRIIARAVAEAGYRAVHNRSGSNLMRGIAAALAQDTDHPPSPKGEGPTGRLPAHSEGLNELPPVLENPSNGLGTSLGDHRPRIGVFEIDEATLPQAVLALRPRILVLLNLFRDQLDRYGEVDTVARLWREALATLPPDSTIVLNADDPLVASLGKHSGNRALYYGLEDSGQALPERERAADFVECLPCGVPYGYSLTYYGHLGHYACPSCGWARPKPDVSAVQVELKGLDGSNATLETPEHAPDHPSRGPDGPSATRVSLSLSLPGLYNVYNLLAATAGLQAAGLPLAALPRAMQGFQPAFGRGERFSVGGRRLVMLLAKNPVGANQVIRLLRSIPGKKPMLLALNDLIADGEDVSWVWDADYEGLVDQVDWAVITGRRAEDLALRLKYAGCFDTGRPDSGPGDPSSGGWMPAILNDPQRALCTALYRLDPGETLYVLPTYTAMLELRQVLNRMGIALPFWEQG